MSDHISSASELILKNAIQAARPGGATHEYFRREGTWEASERQRFAELRIAVSYDERAFEDRALALLFRLNGTYKTHHNRKHLPDVNRCVYQAVRAVRSNHHGTIHASTKLRKNCPGRFQLRLPMGHPKRQ
jgi:hypothetical protein